MPAGLYKLNFSPFNHSVGKDLFGMKEEDIQHTVANLHGRTENYGHIL